MELNIEFLVIALALIALMNIISIWVGIALVRWNDRRKRIMLNSMLMDTIRSKFATDLDFMDIVKNFDRDRSRDTDRDEDGRFK
jgi:hypothetical protein